MRTLRLIWQIPYKIYIGTLFLAFAIVLQPILLLCLRIPRLHSFAHYIFVFWSFCYCTLCGWFIVVKGRKHLRKGKAYTIVANHTSFLDIFLLPMLFSHHKHVFLGKAEILSYPLIRMYFKNYHIPVFRGNKIKAAKSIFIAGKKLQKGWSIVIFPEGGIDDSPKPNLSPFKNGAFQLAKSLESPILPITFKDNYSHLEEPISLRSMARPGIIRITIHPEITREEVNSSTLTALKNRCYEEIHLELMGIPAEKL